MRNHRPKTSSAALTGALLFALFASLVGAGARPAGAAAAATPQEGADPPDPREVEELLEELVALDEYEAGARRRADEIVARLDALPPLEDARDVERWTEHVLELWEDGPELPGKAGEHWLEDEPERGRFFVDGRTRRAKALLVGLHGGGEGSGDAGTSRSAYAGVAKSLGGVAIFPEVLEKTEHGWTDSGTEEFVVELIERARRTYGVDPDRVFLSGHSMGGYGSWTLGGHHADLLAAIAPSAGGPTIVRHRSGRVIGVLEGVVPNLRNVGICVYQAGDDPNVPPDANDIAVEEVRKARERWGGFELEYWREDSGGHDLPPGGMRELIGRIEDFERDPHPERVVWQPTLDWKRGFYWLWWSDPVEDALVEATLDREANSVHVDVRGRAGGLHVQLSPDVLDLDREVVVTRGREEVFRGMVQPRLSVIADTARHGDPGRVFVARIPLKP